MTKKVFVSGCYDMLHSGHVAFGEEAAQLGDLYVGLGSDETIWKSIPVYLPHLPCGASLAAMKKKWL